MSLSEKLSQGRADGQAENVETGKAKVHKLHSSNGLLKRVKSCIQHNNKIKRKK